MNIEKINRALLRRTLHQVFTQVKYQVECMSKIYIFSIGYHGELSCYPKIIHPVMGDDPDDLRENLMRLHRTRMRLIERLRSSGYKPIGILHVECYEAGDVEGLRLLSSLKMANDLQVIDERVYEVDYHPAMVLSNGGIVESTVEFRRIA